MLTTNHLLLILNTTSSPSREHRSSHSRLPRHRRRRHTDMRAENTECGMQCTFMVFTCLCATFIIVVVGGGYLLRQMSRSPFDTDGHLMPFDAPGHTIESRINASFHKDGVMRIIHQSWKTHDLPQRFQLYSKTWRECYPDWQHMLWSDEDNREFIRTRYPWFLKYYDDLSGNIYRADAIRYFYMYEFGGIYADLDADCLKSFEHLLQGQHIVFGSMEGQFGVFYKHGYIQNSFMYSTPRHPFWKDLIINMWQRSFHRQPEYQTGPIMLLQNLIRLEGTYRGQITVYPPQYFNPWSWIVKSPNNLTCQKFNKMTLKEYQQCREYFQKRGSYVVQYHSQTWGGGRVI